VTKPATHMLDFGVTFAFIHDTTQPTVQRCRRNRQILHDSYAFRAYLSDIVITWVILKRNRHDTSVYETALVHRILLAGIWNSMKNKPTRKRHSETYTVRLRRATFKSAQSP